MKGLMFLFLACFSVNTAFAAIYHGIFSGTVENLSEFAPFSNGDAFTLRFEVDTTTTSPIFVGLDIEGVTGTFGNTNLIINDNESGIQDRFTMFSALDSPDGIFDGKPNSNVGLDFVGGTGIFSGTDLAQPFSYAQFDTLSGGFDVNAAEYYGDFSISSGAYLPGSLPQVPVPAAAWLFGSGLLALLGVVRRR